MALWWQTMRPNLRAFDLTEAQRAIRLSLWCQPWHPKKLTFVKEFRSFTDSQKPPVVRTMSKQDRESTDSQRRCEAPEDRGSGCYSAADVSGTPLILVRREPLPTPRTSRA